MGRNLLSRAVEEDRWAGTRQGEMQYRGRATTIHREGLDEEGAGNDGGCTDTYTIRGETWCSV